MYAVIDLIVTVLQLYSWVVIAAAVMSWLTAFGIVNRYNRAVAMIEDVLYRLTEPALRPIRRILPNLGGVDISPVILLLILFFLERFIGFDLVRLIPY
jgi:YggT family protein